MPKPIRWMQRLFVQLHLTFLKSRSLRFCSLAVMTGSLILLVGSLQLLTPLPPAAVAAAKIDIQQKADQLQAALDQTVKAEGMPGAVLLLATADHEWVGASGVSDLKTRSPMKPDDRFAIASASKPFVAVTVLQLAEAGKVDLAAPISAYLPTDVSPHIANSDRITVRQLLNHTSGVAEYLNQKFQTATQYRSREEPWTAKEAIQFIYDAPPQAQPGERFIYTDSNYILLQLIVETITTHPLEAVMRRHVLHPLRLHNTFTELRENLPGGLVSGYSKPNPQGMRQSYADRNLGNGLGDGGLVSTAHDLHRFLRALLVKQSLLSPATLQNMLTFVEGSSGIRYGLGIQQLRGTDMTGAWLGHSGSYAGFQALMFYLPKWDMTVIALSNGDDANVFKVAQAGLAIELGGAS